MNDAIIDRIENVRDNNNSLWMGILRVAMERAPDETKLLLRKIRENDQKISELMGELTHGD